MSCLVQLTLETFLLKIAVKPQRMEKWLLVIVLSRLVCPVTSRSVVASSSSCHY